MTDTPRVAAYARFSSDLQRQASIEDQLRLCRERAEREGWSLVETYEDHAISGASLARPGLQKLLEDARAGRFDLVLSEALDRLSRNQADIAGLYQTLTFSGVAIETLSEGRVDEMHIGLKGTMNTLFLKDLAAKTRRGLRGRIEQGKSGGGNAYGYIVQRQIGDDGEVERGDREIHPDEAAIVRRIFTEYAAGTSPQKIAEQLNIDGVPGPRGRAWDKSTIHGNPKRGLGVLNNELYIGRLVWNRQSFVKDPATGKRQARPNPPEQWIITDVPELRIISQPLWDKVKARQKAREIDHKATQAWERRKPRFLLSNLLKCGCCGGGVSIVSRDRYGCSNARNKGPAYCTNRATIDRHDLEARILHALGEQLMDPELVKVFCKEYVAERNRLQADVAGDRERKERELAKVVRDQDTLVNALLNGTPAARINDRLAQLEARQKQLEAELATSEAPPPVRLHPSMAETYRTRVADLVRALEEPDRSGEARDALRALIDKVVLTPVEGAGKRPLPRIDLHGALAEILALGLTREKALASKAKAATGAAAAECAVFLVAGTGFGHKLPIHKAQRLELPSVA